MKISFQILKRIENGKLIVGKKIVIILKISKKNNLPNLYATGSYYYLLFKVFKFKDMNLKLFLIYLRFYSFLPFHIIKKILKIFFKKRSVTFFIENSAR